MLGKQLKVLYILYELTNAQKHHFPNMQYIYFVHLKKKYTAK